MPMKITRGYTCPHCGAAHTFDAYVFAHWNDVLVHQCPSCKRKNKLRCGKVVK